MKIHWNSKLAKIILLRKFTAITFGKHMFFKKMQIHYSFKERNRLLRHESKHIEQYKLYGFFGFLIRYVWYHVRFGYEGNPFEIEARKAEDGFT